jgi:hypothetical protein
MEIGNAVACQHHRLTIQDRVLDFELARGSSDGSKLVRPVMSETGVDNDLAVNEVHLDAIAVRLDLMSPSAPGWGSVAQGGIAKLNKCWARSVLRSVERCGFGFGFPIGART